MSSLLTNASAMTALQTLTNINKDLSTTQSRISTGLRVSEAADNAAYWSIATTMRSDNQASSVVQDALGLGAGKIDTAYTAMNNAKDVIVQLKDKVLLAKATENPSDRAQIQNEIEAYKAQLGEAASAAYAGTRLLSTDSAAASTNFSVISSYNRASDGNVTTGQIDVALANIRLVDTGVGNTGILDTEFTTTGTGAVTQSLSTIDVTAANLDGTDFNDMLTAIETALSGIITGSAELGAAKSRIDMQMSFTSSLMDAIDRGVGQLVDADMNEESTRLAALQTQQQLGIQALSIANSSAQSILSLFR